MNKLLKEALNNSAIYAAYLLVSSKNLEDYKRSEDAHNSIISVATCLYDLGKAAKSYSTKMKYFRLYSLLYKHYDDQSFKQLKSLLFSIMMMK